MTGERGPVDHDDALSYEVVWHGFNLLVGWCHSLIYREEKMAEPDLSLIRFLEHQIDRYSRKQRGLDADDREAVDRAMQEYGPLCRALYGGRWRPASWYEQHSYVELPGLITSARAAELAAAVERHGEWERFPGHGSKTGIPQLQRFFDGMTSKVLEILRRQGELVELDHWANMYEVGGAISPHVDHAPDGRSADATLVVCLEAPPAANGGMLVLETGEGEEEPETRILLLNGDALLFDGANVEHWTTPLEPSPELAEPRRLVAVSRYYIGGPTT